MDSQVRHVRGRGGDPVTKKKKGKRWREREERVRRRVVAVASRGLFFVVGGSEAGEREFFGCVDER